MWKTNEVIIDMNKKLTLFRLAVREVFYSHASKFRIFMAGTGTALLAWGIGGIAPHVPEIGAAAALAACIREIRLAYDRKVFGLHR